MTIKLRNLIRPGPLKGGVTIHGLPDLKPVSARLLWGGTSFQGECYLSGLEGSLRDRKWGGDGKGGGTDFKEFVQAIEEASSVGRLGSWKS